MRILAEMYQDQPLKCYEVARNENGQICYREQGKRAWKVTVFTELDTYLRNCAENFGYEIEVF